MKRKKEEKKDLFTSLPCEFTGDPKSSCKEEFW